MIDGLDEIAPWFPDAQTREALREACQFAVLIKHKTAYPWWVREASLEGRRGSLTIMVSLPPVGKPYAVPHGLRMYVPKGFRAVGSIASAMSYMVPVATQEDLTVYFELPPPSTKEP